MGREVGQFDRISEMKSPRGLRRKIGAKKYVGEDLHSWINSWLQHFFDVPPLQPLTKCQRWLENCQGQGVLERHTVLTSANDEEVVDIYNRDHGQVVWTLVTHQGASTSEKPKICPILDSSGVTLANFHISFPDLLTLDVCPPWGNDYRQSSRKCST